MDPAIIENAKRAHADLLKHGLVEEATAVYDLMQRVIRETAAVPSTATQVKAKFNLLAALFSLRVA